MCLDVKNLGRFIPLLGLRALLYVTKIIWLKKPKAKFDREMCTRIGQKDSNPDSVAVALVIQKNKIGEFNAKYIANRLKKKGMA